MARLKNRIVIRDPILGPQVFVDKEAHLLQTAEMARLREIKQLGAGYIIYPYANHTRFHHAIGVASFVRFFISALPFEEYMSLGIENRFLLTAAGLLHDIGHSPWSHVGERFGKIRFADKDQYKTHEKFSVELLLDDDDKYSSYLSYVSHLPSVKSILSKEEREKIANLIIGQSPDPKQPWMGNLINGTCDLDRATFLGQDAYFTHSGQALIDPTIVIDKIGIVTRDPGLKDLALLDLPFAESFILARELMYHNVYLATPKLVAENMLIRALNEGLSNSLTFEEFQLSTDEMILSQLHQSRKKFVQRVIKLISCRAIYETIYEQTFDKLEDQVKDNLRMIEKKGQILDLEKHVRENLPISAARRLSKNDFFIIVSSWKSPELSDAWIKEGDEPPKKMSTVSPLLEPTQYQRYIESREKLIIAVDPDKTSGNVAEQLINTTLKILKGRLDFLT